MRPVKYMGFLYMFTHDSQGPAADHDFTTKLCRGSQQNTTPTGAACSVFFTPVRPEPGTGLLNLLV